ncbi:MAG: D-alanyl-D-alanine carboxypeptidase family protein [Patescibacteria group bacterium]
MMGYLLSLLAVMSMAKAPSPEADPVFLYGGNIPIEFSLLKNNTKDSENVILRAELPVKKDARDLGVAHTGQSAFVADVKSAGVLYAHKPHDVHSIASLTKLMTAMVALEANDNLEEEIVFVKEDFDPTVRSELRINDNITRDQVLSALLVGSVNEAANALARNSGMTREEFILRMNQKAREMGLQSLVFTEPTGLDAGNKGNAADVAGLLTAAIRNKDIYDRMQSDLIIITTKFGRQYKIDTTNLLRTSYLNQEPYRIIGAKTGSLPAAGYCLAQVTQNADGNQVVAVLLGSDNHFSRYQDVKALTAWAFDAYRWE